MEDIPKEPHRALAAMILEEFAGIADFCDHCYPGHCPCESHALNAAARWIERYSMKSENNP